jgi:hypothetical protein
MGGQRDETIRILTTVKDFEKNLESADWTVDDGSAYQDFAPFLSAKLIRVCVFRAGSTAEWQHRSRP